ncbi:hypothetical protein GCK32_019321, partial [Trichostrongylus colubriformis]
MATNCISCNVPIAGFSRRDLRRHFVNAIEKLRLHSYVEMITEKVPAGIFRHIKFQNTKDLASRMVSQKEAETKSSRVIINLAPSSSTLVILFGWAGCHDRYLKKYSDYYEK